MNSKALTRINELEAEPPTSHRGLSLAFFRTEQNSILVKLISIFKEVDSDV